MASSTSVLATLLLSALQAAKEAAANNLFNAASPSMLYANNPATTTGLTWGYIGGDFNDNAIANGTVALTNTATNYVVAARSSGAVTAATSTTNWNDSTNYARTYSVVCSGGVITSYTDKRQAVGNFTSAITVTRELQFAVSDETTPLTTGTAKITLRAPRAMTITGVRASLSTAQATSGGGGIVTVDINEAGTTILSTKLTFDNTEKTTTTAATPAVVSDASIADDAEITVDIDQIGDGTACGLKIAILYTS